MGFRARRLTPVAVLFTCGALSALSAAPALAADTWTAVKPGIRRLTRTTSAPNKIQAIEVDLCQPGMKVRATKSSERRRVVSSFASAVGAHVAINADFFSYEDYSTSGLAIGAGQRWTDTADNSSNGFLAFGDQKAVVSRPGAVVNPPEAWMKQVIGGHPMIVSGGDVVQNSTGSHCTTRHPRTAAGLSEDGRKLILAVVDGRTSSSIGMTCNELAALMKGLGAHASLSLDGGGSTTMWVTGRGVVNRPSDGAERVVANHLAVIAGGSGAAAHCPNRAPTGALEAATCEAGISGWAQDPDAAGQALDVELFFDGEPGASGVKKATLVADDAHGSQGNHGFKLAVPPALRDGQPHQVRAYALDSASGARTALGAAKSFTCMPLAPGLPPEGAVRRHVTSGESLTAWGFERLDIAPLADADVASYPDGPVMEAAPVLVQAEGAPEVYVVEYGMKRHITSGASLSAWGWPRSAIQARTPEEVAALFTGAPWPELPFLFQGTGPEVYLLDVPPALRAEVVEATFPARLHAGDEAAVRLKLRNAGSLSWEAGALRLRPAAADQDSLLCDPAVWTSCREGFLATATAAVMPGTVGEVILPLRVPATATPGQVIEECFALGIEAGPAFADPGQGGPGPDALCARVAVVAETTPTTPGTDPPDEPAQPGEPGTPVDPGQPPGSNGGNANYPVPPAGPGNSVGQGINGGCTVVTAAPAAGAPAGLLLLAVLGTLLLRPRRRV